MKMLRSAAIVLAVVACAGLVWESIGPDAGAFTRSCSGFKPETRTMCWRDRL